MHVGSTSRRIVGPLNVQTCERCGQANPDIARFCLGCGTGLSVASGITRETRKTVTVLFCDIVGSTSLSERLDPESVRMIFSRYFQTARSVLEGHGGTVEKFIGDAVLAAFGVPVLREDDAARAVQAAIALRDAMEDLNTELDKLLGQRIAIRIGINTGEVVAGDPGGGQSFVSGDTVNVAARLEQAAAADEILVGDLTRTLARSTAEMEATEPLRLKGKGHEVRAWRVPRLQRDRMGAVGRAISPLTGRDAELGRLVSAFERAVAERRCRTVVLTGSPGVGKSRLVAELVEVLSGRALAVQGRCLAYGEGITYWPLAEAIRLGVGVTIEDTVDQVRAKLAVSLMQDPARDAVTVILLGVLGLGHPAAQEETSWAVRRLIEAVARGLPLVLILDDAQWAESTLLELVEHLRDWVKDAPILMIVLGHPELRRLCRRLLSGSVSESIHLEPLGSEDSRLLVERLGGSLDAGLVTRVLAAAEGNPLFLEEILRMVAEDESRTGGSTDAEQSGPSAEFAMPATIQSLLAARIDRLESGEQAVLERAAVVGKQFFKAPVLGLSPPDVRQRLDEHLDELVARDLVVAETDTASPADSYRFSHLQIRDAAYRRLLKQERALLHERMAEWLEQSQPSAAAGDREDLLGYHLEQAHDYLAQLGRLDERGNLLGRRASAYRWASGRRAVARGDLPGAVTLLARASRGLPPDDPTRPQILLELCECHTALGNVPEAAAALLDVRNTPPGHSDPCLEGRADVMRCELRTLTDPHRLDTDVQVLGEAITRLSAGGDVGGMAHGHAVLGRVLAMLGRLAEAETELDRALLRSREAGDTARARQVLMHLPAVVLWGPVPVTAASGRLTDVLRILRARPGTLRVEAEVLSSLGVLEAMRGRITAANSLLDKSRALLADLGSEIGLCEIAASAGLVALLGDEPEVAERELRSAQAGYDARGLSAGLAHAAAWRSEALYRLGRWDEAADLAGVAQDTAGERSRDAVAWKGVQAKIAARRGETGRAERLASEAVEVVEETDAIVDRADAALTLSFVHALCGRREESLSVGNRAAAFYDAKGHVVGSARARRLSTHG
jgi:class 3 adenylate cyclase/tetratricopeptide (TPR) repeat protein